MNRKISDNKPVRISQNKQKKIEKVKKLTDQLNRATSLIFADYRGLTHKQIETLRKTLLKLNATFTITKNRLIIRALKKSDKSADGLDEFKEPTATLFAFKDEIAPLKELVKLFKDTGIGKIKCGILDQKLLSENEVSRLSKLPTKDMLRTQVVGQLAAPLSGLHNALSWNIHKLMWGLEEIRKKQQH